MNKVVTESESKSVTAHGIFNRNKKWKTIYAIIGKKDGILSEAICGYNSIKIKKCKNEKDLKKQICSQLEIPEDSVYVVKYN